MAHLAQLEIPTWFMAFWSFMLIAAAVSVILLAKDKEEDENT